MTTDLAGLARQLGTVGTSLVSAEWLVRTHKAIGMSGKRTAADVGGTMHRWSKKAKASKPVKLTAGFDADARSTRIKPRPGAMWAIRESGAKPHPIPKHVPRRGRSVVAFDDAVVARVEHPGAGAEHRWTKVRREVNRDAPGIVDKAVRGVLAGVFAGGGSSGGGTGRGRYAQED